MLSPPLRGGESKKHTFSVNHNAALLRGVFITKYRSHLAVGKKNASFNSDN